MTVEKDAKGMFSSEDGPNVLIPCALAATTYEIYDNFKDILEPKLQPHKRKVEFTIEGKPHKIKLYHLLTTIASVKPEFIFTMGRL